MTIVARKMVTEKMLMQPAIVRVEEVGVVETTVLTTRSCYMKRRDNTTEQ